MDQKVNFNCINIKRFLEVGHTQNAGDSMHARIENSTKFQSIYTQKHWAQCIIDSNNTNPYDVKEVEQKEILDFEPLADLFNWKQAKIGSIREIKIIPGNAEVFIKYDFFEDPRQIKVLKKNKKLQDVISHKLASAYSKPIPLNEKKKKDLSSMVKKNLIPVEFIDDFKAVLEL